MSLYLYGGSSVQRNSITTGDAIEMYRIRFDIAFDKSRCAHGRINVPADFDTIEKAFSGVKTPEKGIK